LQLCSCIPRTRSIDGDNAVWLLISPLRRHPTAEGAESFAKEPLRPSNGADRAGDQLPGEQVAERRLFHTLRRKWRLCRSVALITVDKSDEGIRDYENLLDAVDETSP
jgi:hypothetical protein